MAKTNLKKLEFGWPGKVEAILLVIASTVLTIIDVSQNKIIDKFDLGYKTTWFGTIQSSALTNFWVGLLIYFVLILIVIVIAFKQRHTHWYYDLVFGGVAILGLAFLVGGFVSEWALLSNGAFQVPFIFQGLSPVSFYHIGIFLEIISGILFAVTD